MMYVECKPDFLLAQSVTNLPKRQIEHELKGKYEVCKRVSARRDCKGMVDEDPTSPQPVYLTRLDLSEEIPEHGLKAFSDPRRNNLIVLLCPKLEDWILRAATEARLDVDGYGLPNRPSALHRVINVDLRKFDRLLADLIDAGTARMRELRRLLER